MAFRDTMTIYEAAVSARDIGPGTEALDHVVISAIQKNSSGPVAEGTKHVKKHNSSWLQQKLRQLAL